MLLDRFQLVLCAVDKNVLDVLFMNHVDEERQTDTMIQMAVAHEDVQIRRLDQIANSKETSTGVQDHTGFGNHHAGGVSVFVGVISSGPQQMNFHGALFDLFGVVWHWCELKCA